VKSYIVATSGDSCINCIHWIPRTKDAGNDWGCEFKESDVGQGWPDNSNVKCLHWKCNEKTI